MTDNEPRTPYNPKKTPPTASSTKYAASMVIQRTQTAKKEQKKEPPIFTLYTRSANSTRDFYSDALAPLDLTEDSPLYSDTSPNPFASTADYSSPESPSVAQQQRRSSVQMIADDEEDSSMRPPIDPTPISSTTAQRVVAAQKFFHEHYFTSMTYRRSREKRLNDFKEFIAKNSFPDDVRERLWAKFCKRETMTLRQSRKQLKSSEFRILTKIGRGAYGKVYLAIKEDTNEICAIKKMSKAVLFERQHTDSILTERDILSAAQSPWLVKLLYSFQTPQQFFLAMEYVPGGDLRNLLHALERLDVKDSAFYLSEMIEAVTALHSMGYFHRDIKPENFLIDSQGHLKLTDFGLSKSALIDSFVKSLSASQASVRATLKRPKSYTAGELFDFHRARHEQLRQRGARVYTKVGSPDYMAPEILLGQGYDQLVDFWAIGCIFFECLVGYPPFVGSTVGEIFQNITQFDGNLQKPRFMDEEEAIDIPETAWDILGKLVALREHRWGKGKRSLQDLRCHRLFEGLDWGKLREYKNVPFLPKLSNAVDTNYFQSPTESPERSAEDSSDSDEELPAMTDLRTFTFKGFDFGHQNARRDLSHQLREEDLLSPSIEHAVKGFTIK